MKAVLRVLRVIGAGAAMLCWQGATWAQTVIDLTHPIPTFKPMAGDAMKPDLSQPWGDGRLFPTFGQHAVLAMSKFPTNQGHFDLGTLVLSEHHGTHLDAAGHYVNDDTSQEKAGIPIGERKLVHQLGGADLVGKIVLIDISGRVQKELDKNGGKPSSDRKVTDFSNSSPNVVGADDIAAVAGKLRNGVWLVINTGWSKFFFSGPDFAKDPYINGWNHPGMNKQAVDKLIDVLEKKKMRINGIVADNIGIDSGQSALGDDDKWTNSWHAHVRLLQRGIKFVENAANLDQLAALGRRVDRCLLSVGAPKHVRGTGGPSRVMAICS